MVQLKMHKTRAIHIHQTMDEAIRTRKNIPL